MNKQSGQAVLIIVLVMAVALTIGLAIVSRSVTDIRISQQDEQSARAFSAAEAGIEEQIKSNLTIGSIGYGNVGNIGIGYTVTASSFGEEYKFLFPNPVASGDSQYLWLVDHDVNGDPIFNSAGFSGDSLDICWGNNDTSNNEDTTPAIEISLLYLNGTAYEVKRWAFDPNSSRTSSNNFIDSVDNNNITFPLKGFQNIEPAFKVNIDISSLGKPILLNLKLLYNNTQSHWLAVNSGSSLPQQGTCYESKAVITSSGVSRVVYECRGFKNPGSLFDYALFSDDSLSHK